jgi:hypothetical protein
MSRAADESKKKRKSDSDGKQGEAIKKQRTAVEQDYIDRITPIKAKAHAAVAQMRAASDLLLAKALLQCIKLVRVDEMTVKVIGISPEDWKLFHSTSAEIVFSYLNHRT